ncbi:MAG: hypothetical protein WC477_03870 [Patescibacteria group bacterium]
MTLLTFDTYVAIIKNSIGSKMFRHLYAIQDGKKINLLKKGRLSCAFYVSSILALFTLIKKVHATVDSTVQDMEASGWKKIRTPRVGSVLVWEKIDYVNKGIHKHIGFFIGNGKAISNSDTLHHPVKHHWNFNGKRKVEMIFWNPNLNQKKQKP